MRAIGIAQNVTIKLIKGELKWLISKKLQINFPN